LAAYGKLITSGTRLAYVWNEELGAVGSRGKSVSGAADTLLDAIELYFT